MKQLLKDGGLKQSGNRAELCQRINDGIKSGIFIVDPDETVRLRRPDDKNLSLMKRRKYPVVPDTSKGHVYTPTPPPAYFEAIDSPIDQMIQETVIEGNKNQQYKAYIGYANFLLNRRLKYKIFADVFPNHTCKEILIKLEKDKVIFYPNRQALVDCITTRAGQGYSVAVRSKIPGHALMTWFDTHRKIIDVYDPYAYNRDVRPIGKALQSLFPDYKFVGNQGAYSPTNCVQYTRRGNRKYGDFFCQDYTILYALLRIRGYSYREASAALIERGDDVLQDIADLMRIMVHRIRVEEGKDPKIIPPDIDQLVPAYPKPPVPTTRKPLIPKPSVPKPPAPTIRKPPIPTIRKPPVPKPPIPTTRRPPIPTTRKPLVPKPSVPKPLVPKPPVPKPLVPKPPVPKPRRVPPPINRRSRPTVNRRVPRKTTRRFQKHPMIKIGYSKYKVQSEAPPARLEEITSPVNRMIEQTVAEGDKDIQNKKYLNYVTYLLDGQIKYDLFAKAFPDNTCHRVAIYYQNEKIDVRPTVNAWPNDETLVRCIKSKTDRGHPVAINLIKPGHAMMIWIDPRNKLIDRYDSSISYDKLMSSYISKYFKSILPDYTYVDTLDTKPDYCIQHARKTKMVGGLMLSARLYSDWFCQDYSILYALLRIRGYTYGQALSKLKDRQYEILPEISNLMQILVYYARLDAGKDPQIELPDFETILE